MFFDINQITLWNHQYFTVIALYLYCCVVGSVFLPRPISDSNKPRTENIYLHLFFSITLGLSLLITGLFILGTLGWLKITAVLLFMLLLLAFGLFYHRKKYFPLLSYCTNTSFSFWLFPKQLFKQIEFWFILASLAMLLVLSTGTPGLSDDTMYQLPHAVAYLEKANLSLNEYLHLPLIAQNGILLFAWGLMFGNVVLAQMIATLPVMLIMLGLLGISQHLFKNTWVGMIASVIFISQLSVKFILGFAYVDLLNCLFCLAGMFSLFLHLSHDNSPNQTPQWAVLSGLFFGIGFGTKIFALPFIGMAFLILCFYRRWKPILYWAGFIFLFGSSWYLRSWLISGNPIHPLASSLFGYYLYAPIDIFILQAERDGFRASNIWIALQSVGETSLLFSLLVLLWIRSIHKYIRVCLFIWAGGLLFWYYSIPHDRYLIGIIPYASLLISVVIYQCLYMIQQKITLSKILNTDVDESSLLRIIILGVFLFYTIPTAYNYHLNRIKDPYGFLLSREDTGFTGYRVANQIMKPSDGPLLNLYFHRGGYFFNGKTVGQWLGSVRYIDFCVPPFAERGVCQLIPATVMIEKMNKLGSHFVLINKQHFEIPNNYFDYFKVHYQDKETLLLSIK
jgi:hypothetical protein